MSQLLRLLKKQRHTVSKKALASYVDELHYRYNKHTRGKLVADQYRINQAAKSTKDTAGLLDMKDVMSAQKQVEALRVLQDPTKNGDGSTKSQSNRNQRRNKTWVRNDRPSTSDGDKTACFKCKKTGHRARDCPTAAPQPPK